MKLSTALAEPGDATLVVGAMQQKGAHLAVDASIFNILSRMYSRPEEAVTRELICNANDAHIAAGRADVPFELYLPTVMKPEWTLRDFGPGLSKDDVFRLIGGYGESNKRQDLRVIGGFGIGAKSPFAVTTQYTITSWYGGKRMLFAFYKDDEDKPVLSLMDEAASDEPAGMRFSFAVPPDRIQQYITATEVVLARWKSVPPKIFGTERVFNKVKYRIERASFGLRDHMSAGTYRPTGVFAIMGGVAYPVDVKQLSSKYHSLSDANLDLFFEIGDVKPAPSRESLEMTPAVTKALETRIDECSAAIREEAEAVIGKPATFVDAINAKIKLKEFIAVLPASFRQFVVSDVTFKGVSVPDNHYNVGLKLPKDIKYIRTAISSYSGEGSDRLTRSDEKQLNTYHNCGIHVGTNHAVLFRRDLNEDLLRVYNRLQNVSEETFPQAKAKWAVVIFAPRSQAILDALEIYGFTEDLGYLEDVAPAEAPKRERVKTKMRYLSSSFSMMYSAGWSEIDVDLENGGIYQILDRGTPTYSHFETVMKTLQFMGVTIPRIYGIPLSTKSRLTKHKKVWTDFETWATAQMRALDFSALLRDTQDYDEIQDLAWIGDVQAQLQWESTLPPTSEAFKLLWDIETWLGVRPHDWRQNAQKAINAALVLDVDVKPQPSTLNFAAREAKLTSRTPLVAALCRHASLSQLEKEIKDLILKSLS